MYVELYVYANENVCIYVSGYVYTKYIHLYMNMYMYMKM